MTGAETDTGATPPSSISGRWRGASPSARIAMVAAAAALAVAVAAVAVTVAGPGSPPAGAVDACRTELAVRSPHVIPSEWIAAGETARDIREQLSAMPVAAHDRRGNVALILLANGRFATVCVVISPPDLDSLLAAPQVASIHTLVLDEPAPDAVRYQWGTTAIEEPILVAGAAGADVARVEVLRADGVREKGILGRGAWAAWWRERVGPESVYGFDDAGERLGADSVALELPSPPRPISADEARGLCLQDHPPAGEPSASDAPHPARTLDLPLVIADRGRSGSAFLFADGEDWMLCTFGATLEEGHGASSGPREQHDDPIRYRAGSTAGPLGPPFEVAAGTARADVARVDAVLDDGSVVDAQLAAGYWLVSSREDASIDRVRAYDDEGGRIGEITVRRR